MFSLIYLVFSPHQPGYSIDNKLIKIRIFQLIHLKNLIGKNPKQPIQIILKKNNNKSVQFSGLKNFKLMIKPDNIIILTNGYQELFQGQFKSITIRALSKDPIMVGNHIISPRPYYGSFYVYADKGELICIHFVPLNQYLMSVISSEMWGVGNSLESLKAQAVASRSYVLFQETRHRHGGHYLCDTTHCQVYLGAKNINALIQKAVNETNNEILTFDNKVIPAYYHSTCGGRTSTPKEVWGSKGFNFLVGIRDCAKDGKAYCQQSPHYHWQCRIKKLDLQRIFFKTHHHYPNSLILSDWLTGKSERTLSLGLAFPDQSNLLTGEQLRINLGRYLGWNKLKSSYITGFTDLGKLIHFEGKGLGHGIGLCQYGAARMAELGFSYQEILQHYFPKCRLSKRH